MAIEKLTISRNDDTYECFPYICRSRTGRIILTYRESNGHVASEFCRLIVRTSDDAGHTWSEAQVIRDEDKSTGILTTWNCPKIQQLKDGRILLLCDTYLFPPGEWGEGEANCHIALWFSDDDGESWSDPIPTPVKGICPDIVTEMDDGRWMLPSNVTNPKTERSIQNITTSRDEGRTWEAPLTIFDSPDRELGEATIVPCPNGELVVYLREDSGSPLQKMISTDGGYRWEGPYDTLNPAAHGMPVAGLTQDGFMLIVGRFGLRSCWRVDMSEETWGKRLARRTIVIPRVPANESFIARRQPGPSELATDDEVIVAAGGSSVHTFAFLEPLESALDPDKGTQKGLLLPLDLDANNLGADSGYASWVEYERGKFLAVNYINDDAPMAQIRGYRFGLEDF
jgi:sialidase-1